MRAGVCPLQDAVYRALAASTGPLTSRRLVDLLGMDYSYANLTVISYACRRLVARGKVRCLGREARIQHAGLLWGRYCDVP